MLICIDINIIQMEANCPKETKHEITCGHETIRSTSASITPFARRTLVKNYTERESEVPHRRELGQ